MTKKNLIWRLKDKPSVEDVTELLKEQVVTKEEARDLLFNEAGSDSEKLRDLKKQVEYLEDLVKELSKSRVQNYPVVTPAYVEKWIERKHWEPSWIYYSSNVSSTGSTFTNNTSIGDYTQKLIG